MHYTYSCNIMSIMGAEQRGVLCGRVPLQNEATAAELQPKEEQLEHMQATVQAQVGVKWLLGAAAVQAQALGVAANHNWPVGVHFYVRLSAHAISQTL
jgi:hypothetical protein